MNSTTRYGFYSNCSVWIALVWIWYMPPGVIAMGFPQTSRNASVAKTQPSLMMKLGMHEVFCCQRLGKIEGTWIVCLCRNHVTWPHVMKDDFWSVDRPCANIFTGWPTGLANSKFTSLFGFLLAFLYFGVSFWGQFLCTCIYSK